MNVTLYDKDNSPFKPKKKNSFLDSPPRKHLTRKGGMRMTMTQDFQDDLMLKTTEMDFQEDIKFTDFANLMQKKSILRSDCEKKMMTNYLKEHRLLQILQKSKTPDMEMSEICQIFADNAERIDLNENEILFKIGEVGDKFFLVLSGEVQVLKPIRKKVYLTPKDFLRYLYQLKKEDETFLLNMCIKSNYEKYCFKNFEEFLEFNSAALKIKLRNYLTFSMTKECFNFKKVKEIFLEELKTFEDFDLNEDLSKSMNLKEFKKYLFEENKNFKEKDFENAEKIYYKYLEIFDNELDNIRFNIIEYDKTVHLGEGYTFGDYALDNEKLSRTATIKASRNSILCYLTEEVYYKYILDETIKLRKRDLILLNEKNPILNAIGDFEFERHYLKKFRLNVFNKNEIIIKQNDLTDKILFIKEGECDLIYQGNTFEVNQHIETIIEQCKLREILEDKEVELMKSEFSNPKINQIKSDSFLKQAKKAKKFFLKTAKKGDIIGVESALLDFPYLYNIQIKSNVAQIYFMDVCDLFQILKRYKKCKRDFMNFSLQKIKAFFSRIRCVKLTRERKLIEDEYCLNSDLKNIVSKKNEEKRMKKIPLKLENQECVYPETIRQEIIKEKLRLRDIFLNKNNALEKHQENLLKKMEANKFEKKKEDGMFLTSANNNNNNINNNLNHLNSLSPKRTKKEKTLSPEKEIKKSKKKDKEKKRKSILETGNNNNLIDINNNENNNNNNNEFSRNVEVEKFIPLIYGKGSKRVFSNSFIHGGDKMFIWGGLSPQLLNFKFPDTTNKKYLKSLNDYVKDCNEY